MALRRVEFIDLPAGAESSFDRSARQGLIVRRLRQGPILCAVPALTIAVSHFNAVC